MDTETVLAAHKLNCVTYNVDMALENGASLDDNDVQARQWAAVYLDDNEMCVCADML